MLRVIELAVASRYVGVVDLDVGSHAPASSGRGAGGAVPTRRGVARRSLPAGGPPAT